MQPKILKYGGHGVAVGLKTMHDPGPDTVYWSAGANSYVLVEPTENGLRQRGKDVFTLPDGRPVALMSINGIGECRWEVDVWQIRHALEKPTYTNSEIEEGLAACRHFGLMLDGGPV